MLSRITQELETSRSESEIVEVIGELLDKVWYYRHLFLEVLKIFARNSILK